MKNLVKSKSLTPRNLFNSKSNTVIYDIKGFFDNNVVDGRL